MKICPRCNKRKIAKNMDFNAISRRDNETVICYECDMEESLIDSKLCPRTDEDIAFAEKLKRKVPGVTLVKKEEYNAPA